MKIQLVFILLTSSVCTVCVESITPGPVTETDNGTISDTDNTTSTPLAEITTGDWLSNITDDEGSGSTSDAPGVEETSPSSSTITTAPACKDGESTSTGCICGPGRNESLRGYCAKPCDPEFLWCPNGAECDLIGNGNSYTCPCAAGFYNPKEGEETEDCIPGQFFGGKIKFEGEFKEESEWHTSTTLEIEDFLNDIYNDTTGFVSAEVLEVTKGSIVGEYKLTYKAGTDESVVRVAFDNYTEDCNNTGDPGPDLGQLNCTFSKENAVDETVLCDLEFSDYCHDNSKCTNPNGLINCKCDIGYSKRLDSDTSCRKIICLANNDCNDPFGTCDRSTSAELDNYCNCMWGFSGDNCKNPWEFTFTIVTAGLGLILIGVIIGLICKSRSLKSEKKKQMQDDLNLQNPFVDFQPGIVRAKMPSTLHHVYDAIDLREGAPGPNKRNSYSNGAYSHTLDDYVKKPSTFQNDYQTASLSAPGKTNDTDYF